jgi:acyl transferase domain-containing protein
MPAAHAPMAVIGLACRFPQASDPMAYWNLLQNAGDAIGRPTDVRMAGLSDCESPSRGGYLSEASLFDFDFLGFSAAENADARQALALELAWEALEDGGQRIEELRGSTTGVFLGVTWSSLGGGGGALDLEAGMIPGRVSHHLGLRGPSLLVDTATSSSLVAVHLACQSLRNGEAGLALAGGVNLFRSAREWVELGAIGVLSAEGRCRPFDRDARGYVRGEGGGVALLKPLEAAQRDGDRIYCVIEASAINHNGETAGMPAPSSSAQLDLLDRAYRWLPANGSKVAYVEAHGTGTRAGDEAEWRALEAFFSGERAGKLAVGSVKSNIGHLEGAAGIAGLMKAALAAKAGVIPPTINITVPRFSSVGMSVQTSATVWPADSNYCGVTSLGLYGTNCHVVISRPPESVAASHAPPPWLFVMSAHTEAALNQYANALSVAAGGWTESDLPEVCYTAATRRSHQKVRRAFFCRSMEEFRRGLQGLPTAGDDAHESARVFERGGEVNWKRLFPCTGRCVSLPPYPWQRRARKSEPAGRAPADTVRRLVARVLRVPAEDMTLGTRLIELGLDSLSALQLESQLESQTGVQIPAPELLGALTVSDLITYVENGGRPAS